MTRKIKVQIACTGKNLRREAYSFETREIPDAEALEIYRALTDAVAKVMGMKTGEAAE